MATVGQDFAPYREHFTTCGIGLGEVKELPELFTAQAFITTDLDDNQITAFHPGAMMRSNENHVRDVEGGHASASSHPTRMRRCCSTPREFAERGIPFIFDPGQAMPLFNGEEFRSLIEMAQFVTVNDYESQVLQERTGWTPRDIAARVKGYIVTRGAQGLAASTPTARCTRSRPRRPSKLDRSRPAAATPIAPA